MRVEQLHYFLVAFVHQLVQLAVSFMRGAFIACCDSGGLLEHTITESLYGQQAQWFEELPVWFTDARWSCLYGCHHLQHQVVIATTDGIRVQPNIAHGHRRVGVVQNLAYFLNWPTHVVHGKATRFAH